MPRTSRQVYALARMVSKTRSTGTSPLAIRPCVHLIRSLRWVEGTAPPRAALWYTGNRVDRVRPSPRGLGQHPCLPEHADFHQLVERRASCESDVVFSDSSFESQSRFAN